jgi:uncharacterized damage-inducible protein DinB
MKRWADRDLFEAAIRNQPRLTAKEGFTMLRILDHMHVVDRVFQHHLQGLPHSFHAPRSEELPSFQALASSAAEVDDWYASYVRDLPERDFDQPVDFIFTNGSPGRMLRGEMILHVCLHGTYHRGNAGIVLQKNGISPNDDRMTDFLERAA